MDIQALLPDDLFSFFLLLLGFAASFGFMMRQVIQWYLSERAGKVLSPLIYWQISLTASFLFILYGVGRGDLAIILGQVISYYIYVRNLHLKASWSSVHIALKTVIIVMPFMALWAVYILRPDVLYGIFTWAQENSGLALFGTLGFLVMALRFVYQWIISEKEKESSLPIGFWLISMLGAGMLFIYGWYRLDIVLILSNSLNVILYMRNIMIGRKEQRS